VCAAVPPNLPNTIISLRCESWLRADPISGMLYFSCGRWSCFASCAGGAQRGHPFCFVGEWLSLVEHLVRDTVEIH
jgi:hypothetical protein